MKTCLLLVFAFLSGLLATGQTTNTLIISYSASDAKPPVYTFKSDIQGEALKYYWYFGDESISDSPNPVYTFKYSKSYLITLKVTDKANVVYYGKLEARFEGVSQITTSSCKAYFTFANSVTNGVVAPKKITFTNQSSGEINSCKWSFGDGTTSTDRSPSHEYAAYGEYKVCLVIGTASGCASDYCATVKVTAPITSPVIVYGKGYVKNPGLAGCGLVIVLAEGTVINPVQNATDFILKEGQYVEVAYEVLQNVFTNCMNGKAVKIHKIALIPTTTACKAYFTWGISSATDLVAKKVSFTNNSTGEIRELKWSFGDGTYSTEKNPVHAYANYGEYKVCLVIATTSGCTSEYCTAVKITNPATCKAYFTYTYGKTSSGVVMPKTIAFTNQSTGELNGCKWSFGDGTYSTEKSPVHEYAAFGEYKVCLVITTTASCTSDYCAVVKITNPATCKAYFTFAKVTTSAGEVFPKKIAFTNQSTGELNGCKWSFGDGTYSTEKNPIHEYAAFGEYKVCLVITTTASCTSDYCAEVKITNPATCKAYFTFTNSKTEAGVVIPKKIAFTNQSTGELNGCKWSFGDGTYSTEKSPVHEYAAFGEYKVCLVITTTASCTSDYCATVKVAEDTACKAYFTATNALWSNPDMMKKMAFTNLSTGDLKECSWTFGDGSTSNECKPVHEYANFGEYKVCLVITTVNGCKSEYCTTVKVTNPLCNFEIVIKPKEQTTKTFLFYAISQVEIKTWKWTFGDGGTSEAQNPSHTYEKSGTYEVSCTITTSTGCTQRRVIKLTVSDPQLPLCAGSLSLLLFDPAGGICNGKAVVKLLNEAGTEYPNVKYTWSTGATGNTAEKLCPNKTYSVNAVVEGICQKSTAFTFLTSPSFQINQSGEKSTFSVVSPTDDLIYRWDFGDGNFAFGPAVDYSYENSGVYNVVLTAISGSNSASNSQFLSVEGNTTSLKEVPELDFNIFPNPVRDLLKIELGNSVDGDLSVEITDMKGMKSLEYHLPGSSFNHLIEIPVNNLPEGIYLLRIININQVCQGKKFIKK
jgi:PKD repeat protein